MSLDGELNNGQRAPRIHNYTARIKALACQEHGQRSARHQVKQHKESLECHQVCRIEQITQYEDHLCSWGIFRGKLAIRAVSEHNITQRNQDLIKGHVHIWAIAM